MKKHADYSPSSAARWLTQGCSAFLIYKQKIPLPETTSEAANRGIQCHKKVEAGIKKISCEVILSDEDNEITKQCVNYINTLPGEKHIEETVIYIPNILYGTPDLFIFTDNHTHLQVIDYKFGRMEVKVKNNVQLAVYALAIIKSYPQYKIKTVVGTIIQPALFNTPNSYEYTLDELEQLVEDISHTILDVTNGLFKFKVGEQCGFCEYKSICPSFLFHAQIQTGKITPALMNTHLPKISALEQWIDELKSEAVKFLENGGELEDFRLANRSMKEWKDENQLVDYLKNKGIQMFDLYNIKLKTVTQVEKILKFEDLNSFIEEKKSVNYLKKK